MMCRGLQHPQLATLAVGPVGAQGVPALKPPAGLDGVEPRMDPVPALGEHTEAVLSELGYSTESIAGLRAQAAI
jgi:formyl-CoA transferase